MDELRSNSEIQPSSTEISRPEPAKVSEDDKRKLTPRENDVSRMGENVNDKKGETNGLEHPKLEVNNKQETNMNDQPDREALLREKLTYVNPEVSRNTPEYTANQLQDSEQAGTNERKSELPWGNINNMDQSKELNPEQMRNDEGAPDQHRVLDNKPETTTDIDQNPEQINGKELDSEQAKPSVWEKIGGLFGQNKHSDEVNELPGNQRDNWEGLETEAAPNGSGWTMLPGNHFDKYSDIDKNYDKHHRVDIPKEEQTVQTVNPSDIEGVYLGDSEVQNPDNFWGMHNGSKEGWMDTASHIPEVRDRLNNGESLESLLEDDRLGSCTNAYFNPDNPKAIKVDEMPDGGYIFSGDGRHRIIAARSLGYDIPVKIAGKYEY